ncbi:hypothetical protein [Nonomuraea pusilla]|uniref:hypothetical protein n=1 Tax=Nonomuraea pusilla TaxID=46177 RepID=UPI0021092E8E|nr:hypothetical protein [Nonomuraea pusilla]
MSPSNAAIGHRSLSRWIPSRRLASAHPALAAGQLNSEPPIALTSTLPSVANLAGDPSVRTPS